VEPTERSRSPSVHVLVSVSQVELGSDEEDDDEEDENVWLVDSSVASDGALCGDAPPLAKIPMATAMRTSRPTTAPMTARDRDRGGLGGGGVSHAGRDPTGCLTSPVRLGGMVDPTGSLGRCSGGVASGRRGAMGGVSAGGGGGGA